MAAKTNSQQQQSLSCSKQSHSQQVKAIMNVRRFKTLKAEQSHNVFSETVAGFRLGAGSLVSGIL